MWGITDRRHFMKHVAGAAAVSLATDSFLTRLRAESANLQKKNKSLIVIHFGGGYSSLDFWEEKDGHANFGETKSGATNVSGIKINELLEKTRKQMDSIALIRSLQSTEGDHARGTRVMMTGLPINPLLEHPHIGSKVAWLHRENEGDLPPFISVFGGGGIGPGFLGQKFGALPINNPGQPPENVRPPMGIDTARMERRGDLLGRLESGFQKSTGSDRDSAKAHQEVLDKALSLVVSKNKDVFTLDKEPDSVKKFYGLDTTPNNAFARGMLLAAKLTAAGASCVEVNNGGWDNHAGIFARFRTVLPGIDAGIGGLIAHLKASGRLKDTVVVTLSEFGRTPRINANVGRDHYPRAWQAMIAGGNIKGGQAYGKTDAGAEGVTENGVKVGDLFATIYAALGIDPETQIRDPFGRPAPIAGEKATPIKALLA